MNISCRVYLLFHTIIRISKYFYNKHLAGICNGEKHVFSLSEKLKSLKWMKRISSFNKEKVPQLQPLAVYIHSHVYYLIMTRYQHIGRLRQVFRLQRTKFTDHLYGNFKDNS